MTCPCKGCELRRVEIRDGKFFDCHSGCPKDVDGVGYKSWKIKMLRQREETCTETDRYQKRINWEKNQRYAEYKHKGTHKFAFGSR